MQRGQWNSLKPLSVFRVERSLSENRLNCCTTQRRLRTKLNTACQPIRYLVEITQYFGLKAVLKNTKENYLLSATSRKRI